MKSRIVLLLSKKIGNTIELSRDSGLVAALCNEWKMRSWHPDSVYCNTGVICARDGETEYRVLLFCIPDTAMNRKEKNSSENTSSWVRVDFICTASHDKIK